VHDAVEAAGARVDVVHSPHIAQGPDTRLATLDAIRASMAAGRACYAFDAVAAEFHCIVECLEDACRYVGRGRHGGETAGVCDLAGPCWVATVTRRPPHSDVDAIRVGVGAAFDHDGAPSVGPDSLAALAESFAAALESGGVPSSIVERVAEAEERRGYAVEFMWEAKERLRGRHAPLFNTAAEQYDRVARRLAGVQAALSPPVGPPSAANDARADAARLMDMTCEAETRALDALEDLSAAL
jgi:hypothetical protein